MNRLRIYVDTSVIGGCLDKEFEVESNTLIGMARRGEVVLIVSYLLLDELDAAPEPVRAILETLPSESIELLERSQEAEALRDYYLEYGVLGAASQKDAHHVALAAVARADMIVSWNFAHIVHYDKIRGFNAVNLLRGYPPIAIYSPKEVV